MEVSLNTGATETDYLNAFGQIVASSTLANGLTYDTYNLYDGQSRLVLAAQPSAVTSIDPTLLSAAVVNQSSGLVDVTNYDSDGNLTAIGVNQGMPSVGSLDSIQMTMTSTGRRCPRVNE